MRAGERPAPAPGLGHLPGKLVVDCRPRVAPGRGHRTEPWKIRRGLASPVSDRESGTQTGTPARTETANPSDSGTDTGTGAERETGASAGTGTGTGGGTETPATTDTGSRTFARVNKEFGKSPARAGHGTDPAGRPGTQPRPPGPRLGKPRSRRSRGRSASGTVTWQVNTLQGDTCPRTPGLDKKEWNITSQRLKDSWNAINANTCALGEPAARCWRFS